MSGLVKSRMTGYLNEKCHDNLSVLDRQKRSWAQKANRRIYAAFVFVKAFVLVIRVFVFVHSGLKQTNRSC